jgi:hypothetical protein
MKAARRKDENVAVQVEPSSLNQYSFILAAFILAFPAAFAGWVGRWRFRPRAA